MGQKGGPNLPIQSCVFTIDSKNTQSSLSSLRSLFTNFLGSVTGTTISGNGFTASYTFAGTTHKIDFSDQSILKITSALSISSWIYPVSFGGANAGRIYDKWKTTVPQSGYGFFIDNAIGTNALAFGTGWVISTSVARVSNVITLNIWQHVSVTFAGGACTFYVNGVSVGTVTSITAPTSGTNSAIVGNSTGDANYFDGKIDNLRIYNRSLNGVEILQIYNATKTRYGL